MSTPQNPKIKKLRELIEASFRIAVLTGAGISTESGISDYRSKGGIWNRFQPVTIQEFLADEGKRKVYWQRKKEMFVQIKEARPNEGHLALARLEKQGKLLGLITQNIDGLHKIAGNKKIIEIHGTNREVICLECRKVTPFDPVFDRLEAGEEIPLCKSCSGLLKPNTISFGQTLEVETLNQAVEWSRSCDLMLAIGSTLVVEPAASLPLLSNEAGSPICIINRDATPLDSVASVVIHDAIGQTLSLAIDGKQS